MNGTLLWALLKIFLRALIRSEMKVENSSLEALRVQIVSVKSKGTSFSFVTRDRESRGIFPSQIVHTLLRDCNLFGRFSQSPSIRGESDGSKRGFGSPRLFVKRHTAQCRSCGTFGPKYIHSFPTQMHRKFPTSYARRANRDGVPPTFGSQNPGWRENAKRITPSHCLRPLDLSYDVFWPALLNLSIIWSLHRLLVRRVCSLSRAGNA